MLSVHEITAGHQSLVVVVCIFYYFHLYLQKSIKKEEGRSGTTGTGVSQKDQQRGAKRTKKKMSLKRRGAQCKLEAGAIVEELKNN